MINMRYLVKEYKIFGKYDVEVWIDDIDCSAEKIIKTSKGIKVIPLSPKTTKKYIKRIRSGKIQPLYTYVTDLDL